VGCGQGDPRLGVGRQTHTHATGVARAPQCHQSEATAVRPHARGFKDGQWHSAAVGQDTRAQGGTAARHRAHEAAAPRSPAERPTVTYRARHRALAQDTHRVDVASQRRGDRAQPGETGRECVVHGF
jgi:hypothetical protein